MKCATILLLVLVSGPTLAQPKTHRTTADDRKTVAITVYNMGTGLVRETREFVLGKGVVALECMDVAARIEPHTVHVASLANPASLAVLEQSYQYDLLNPQKLLDKYVGKRVKVFRWNDVTGRDEEREAEVVSTNGGVILKIGDEITFAYPGRIAFPEIPADLIARPTLVWLLENALPKQKIEVSYLTGGMTWRADYVLIVNQADTGGALTGWVTLDNQSGATYQNAKLKLVAGDVRRVRGESPHDMRALEAVPMIAMARDQFKEEAFFEYHLYTLQRPTTLRDNEQKQVTLLEAPQIKLVKRLIFYGAPHYFRGPYSHAQPSQKVGVYLDLENTKENGMGMPLPKGIVRVYKADSEGALQFIGEDAMDHTPRDERVRIKMGEAFDVVAERRQTEWKTLGACASESSWEISVRNRKDEAATVEVVEPAGGEWEVLSSSHEWTKEDARTFRFRVSVPKGGEVKIHYRVRAKWC